MPATAAVSDVVETVADLLDRLGGISASRVRMRPTPGTATENDLKQAPGRVCELVDGVLVEKPMGCRESALAMYIGGLLGSYIRPGRLGVILGEAGFLRVFPGQVRAPDVTFIPWSAFPGGRPPDEPFWSVAPDLIVEVLSPTNTTAEIDRKLTELFRLGCKLAWVIDPETESAKVYTSAKRFKEYERTATLDGGKGLPGFTLSLADLFAHTEPPA